MCQLNKDVCTNINTNFYFIDIMWRYTHVIKSPNFNCDIPCSLFLHLYTWTRKLGILKEIFYHINIHFILSFVFNDADKLWLNWTWSYYYVNYITIQIAFVNKARACCYEAQRVLQLAHTLKILIKNSARWILFTRPRVPDNGVFVDDG